MSAETHGASSVSCSAVTPIVSSCSLANPNPVYFSSITRWKMQVGSSADAATCAQTTRSSFRPFKDKRPRREIRSVSEPASASAACWCVPRNEPLFSRWRNCRWCCGRPMSSWRGRWLTNRIWKIVFKQPTKKLLQRFQIFSSLSTFTVWPHFLQILTFPCFFQGTFIHSRSECLSCWKIAILSILCWSFSRF